MGGTTGCDPARVSESLKTVPSSDWSLQLDSMKPESLVIADQLSRGEYALGACTHRRHITEVGNARSQWPNLYWRELPKVGSVTGMKS